MKKPNDIDIAVAPRFIRGSNHHRGSNRSGFVLLLSVLITSLLLTIGMTLYNIATREFDISAASRDSMAAFYAAETGYECTIYWDLVKYAFDPAVTNDISCDGKTMTVGGAGVQTFNYTLDYSPYQAAVDIDATDPLKVNISAKGYSSSAAFARRKIRRHLSGTSHHAAVCPYIPLLGERVIDITEDLAQDPPGPAEYWLYAEDPDWRDVPPSQHEHGYNTVGYPFYTLPVPILPGTYDITLVSFDDHAAKLNQTQENEQWYAKLYDSAGTLVFTTNSISDLPNKLEFLTETVNTGVSIGSSISRVSIHHSWYPGGGSSISAACIVFTPA